MLPLILFSGFLVFSHYKQNREEAFARVQQVTRGVKLVLDREAQGIVGGLTVLANTRSLAADDFQGFRLNAEAYVRQFPGSPSIVIANESGQLIFHSRIPAGQLLPVRADRPERREVFETGKPVFSRLFLGPVAHRPIVTITVPVFRDGKVIYDLSFDPPLEIFQRIIEQQRPSEDWTLSIFDQDGTNFARVPNPAATIGQRASPSLYAVMFSAPEGRAPTVSLEGVPLLTAFSLSELTGWIAAAGIAESTLTAPALQTAAIAVTVGLLMLLIGLGFAIRMATQIARGEALHALLINELNHRVRNTLATVQSMASQTFRGSTDREAKHKFSSRLVALGAAHNLLSDSKWAGADLRETIETVLEPFRAGQRIALEGPAISIDARIVTMLSMVIQELATNASKYGALTHADGRVTIHWEQTEHSDARVVLCWIERDGPPVTAPLRSGFGSTLIREGFAAQLGGSATMAFEPDGLTCVLEFPLRRR